MTDFGPQDVVFVGHGNGVVNWYRCGVPAMALGAKWVGVDGDDPDELRLSTGLHMDIPDLFSAKVVVLQLMKGRGWRDQVKKLRGEGVKVLYEIDDYIHDLGEGHEAQVHFDAKRISDHEAVMSVCDGIITTNDWLAKQYAPLAPTRWPYPEIERPAVWVCRTGLDVNRYKVTRPQREKTVNIGWAGSIGHKQAVESWLPGIWKVMRDYPDTRFVTIGSPYADQLKDDYPGRTMAIPFTTVENYPAALCNFDIALGPAADSGFFRGKSDLRYLEASAVGIPGVWDKRLYQPKGLPGINDGLYVSSPEEAEDAIRVYLDDREKADRVGKQAQSYVLNYRKIEDTIGDWITAFEEVTD